MNQQIIFTVSREPSFLQLLSGDDTRREIQFTVTELLLLFAPLVAGVEFPKPFGELRLVGINISNSNPRLVRFCRGPNDLLV